MMKSMKGCFWVYVLGVVVSLNAANVFAADFPANDLEKPGYTLDFNDEFDNVNLDVTKWTDQYLPHWATDISTTTADYNITDGYLNLYIDANTPAWDYNQDPNFKVSAIQSYEKNYIHKYDPSLPLRNDVPTFDGYSTKYGYFEIRAKLPNCGGGGHTAWWMVGCQDDQDENGNNTYQTGEIDIIEPLFNSSNNSLPKVHPWADPNLTEWSKKVSNPGDPKNEYHIYGMEWDPTGIKFYYDNKLIAETSNSPNYKMFMFFSVYTNTNWSGKDNGVYPKTFSIDYIRVYKKDGGYTDPANLAHTATASVTGAKAPSIPYNLIDGHSTSGIVSVDNPTFPQYITLNWNTGQTFSAVNLKSWYCQGQAPTNWDIEVSDDGSTNWTTVASSGNVIWARNDGTIESKQINFPTVTNKKGVRIKINKANLSWKHYVVNEIEVFNQDNLATIAALSVTGVNNSNAVSNLNDGNDTSGIVSLDNPTFPQYITLNWSAEKTFSAVNLKSWYCQGQAPTNWDIEVSDDGSTNWTKVASSGNVSWSKNDSTVESKMINFSPVTNKKGLRIKINSANLSWKHYVINEIECY